MKILVVDDSKAMRLIVVRTLRQAGFANFTINEAENGKAALDAVIGGAIPDFVLCDWNMPIMSGIEFLRKLRAAAFQVPFFFVTSESSREMRDLALKEGAMAVITKPFMPESFKTALERVFK